MSTAIFVYAATSPVNGYFGGSLYARMGGKRWIRQMLVSAFLVPSVVCGTEFFINFIAIYYHASRAIPFGSMVSWYTWYLRYRSHSFITVFIEGCNHLHMPVYYSTFDVGWYRSWEKFIWSAWLSLSCQRRSSTNSREKMVHGTSRDCNIRRHSSFRVNFHRNVSTSVGWLRFTVEQCIFVTF